MNIESLGIAGFFIEIVGKKIIHQFVEHISVSLWIQTLSEKVLNPPKHTPFILPKKVLGLQVILLGYIHWDFRQKTHTAHIARFSGASAQEYPCDCHLGQKNCGFPNNGATNIRSHKGRTIFRQEFVEHCLLKTMVKIFSTG